MIHKRHFFICGAQRSASTYLSRLLDSHTAIEMARPIRPEPKVFLNPESSNLTPKLYRDQWHKNATDQTVWFGEKSTSYIEDPMVPERILSVFTKPKFIFILRDPVERAISNFHFSKMNGYEDEDINTALLREINDGPDNIDLNYGNVSVSPKAYLARGRYVDFLKPYFQIVPEKDILLLESSRLTSTVEEKNLLFQFLDLSQTDNTFTNEPINESRKDSDDNLKSETRSALQQYFLDPNLLLEKTFDFKTSDWV